MRFQYQVSMQDFMSAQRLHLAKHLRRVLLPAVVVIPVVMLAVVVIEHSVLPENMSVLALVLVLQLLVLVGLICMLFALQWKRAYDSDQRWRQDITIELTDEFVVMAMSDGRSELKWSAFREVVENSRLFLLYLGPRMFCIVPKRAIGAEGTQVLRTQAGQR